MTGTISPVTGMRLTFMGMIAEYGRIEIPLIQRDYAHGRNSATSIRNRILDSLFDALDQGHQLSLDFVYGELDDSFTPIDGQQRLTTLFLLHWMLALAANRLQEFQRRMVDEQKRPRFCYTTRPASSRFFRHLLTIHELNPVEEICGQIENSPKFFFSWRQDPTVASALVVLGAIQDRLAKRRDTSNLYARLTDEHSALITVDTLDLGHFGLSDEIYVKMNARGKELTGFEKFKAWLIERHPNLRWPEAQDDLGQWPVLMDGDWLDLFWAFHHGKAKPAEAAGIAYFRTVIALATNFHAAEGRYKSAWESAADSGDDTVWDELFTENSLVFVFRSLALLSVRDAGGLAIVGVRQRLLEFLRLPGASESAPFLLLMEDESARITFPVRLWLHAICVVLMWEFPARTNNQNHWFRIVRNILDNNDIDADKYQLLVRCIDDLATAARDAHDGDVLRALIDESTKVHGADGFQIVQERLKASLMCQLPDGGDWEAALIEAEAHAMFGGEIGLILTEGCTLDQFRSRWECVSNLLGNEGSKIGDPREWLLLRAVLAKAGDIGMTYQQKINFDGAYRSWAELLNGGSGMRGVPKTIKENFRRGFRDLVDELRGHIDLLAGVKNVIFGYRENGFWVADLVRYGPALLEQSRDKKVQQYYNEGVYVFNKSNLSEDDILLGPGARMRNALIDRMRSAAVGPWLLDTEDRVVAVSEGMPPLVMYAGHTIQLNRQLEGDADDVGVYCKLYSGSLELGVESAADSQPFPIGYPESADIRDLGYRIRELLADENAFVNQLLRPALAQIEELTAEESYPEVQQDSRHLQ